MTKNPRILIGAGWMIFLLVIAAALPFTSGAQPPPFDKARWRASANTPSPNPRSQMVDAIKELLPPGTPVAQVTALLGPPSWTEGGALVYFVGGESIINRLPYLMIRFDSQRRVTRLDRITD